MDGSTEKSDVAHLMVARKQKGREIERGQGLSISF